MNRPQAAVAALVATAALAVAACGDDEEGAPAAGGVDLIKSGEITTCTHLPCRDSLNQYVSMTPILIAGLAYLIITVPLGYVVRRLEAQQAKAR